jgi:hypothetical protein
LLFVTPDNDKEEEEGGGGKPKEEEEEEDEFGIVSSFCCWTLWALHTFSFMVVVITSLLLDISDIMVHVFICCMS